MSAKRSKYDRNEFELDPAAPVLIPATVNADGVSLQRQIHDVIVRRLQPILDSRGSVMEAWDARWGILDLPVTFTEVAMVRPGVVKGWVRHAKNTDRVVGVRGDLRWSLYDDREGSPTCGVLNHFVLGPRNPILLVIPIGVWHAAWNLSSTEEAIFLNHPTRAYQHAEPDKELLPLENDVIPYQFP